jgi:hypothetical protein
MVTDRGLHELIQHLVEVAYPEFMRSNITTRWGRTSCFATVSWTADRMRILVTCNTQTKKWHEAALIGLLSHELSHPIQERSGRAESKTDLDVICRGLGPYLAVERASSGKYEDYVISRGKDKYLGYRSIRSLLNAEELIQLDALLQEMQLIPQKNVIFQIPHQDLAILKTEGKTEISIDGHTFTLDGNIDDSQIEIIIRNGISHVYHKGQEIGKYD